MPVRPRGAALVLLIVLGVIAGWLGRLHLSNEIDVANRALKSRGSVEASDLERHRSEFGDDRRILLGWSVAAGLSIDADETEALQAAARGLRDLGGVADVQAPSAVEPGLACLAVRLRHDAPLGVVDEVRAMARAATPPTLTLRVTAPQLAEREIATALDAERNRVVPLVAVTLTALLWWTYRSLAVALIVLAPAVGSIAITGGLFAFLGHRIDPIVTLLDPVLLTVGVATGVHLVESFGRLRDPAAVRAELAAPIGWTTATTAVGFVAVSWTELPAVAAFGVWAAFGVALVAALSYAAVPLWLATCGAAGRLRTAPVERAARHTAALSRGSTAILATAAVVLAVAGAGLARVEVDNDPIRLLPADGTFRRDHDWLVRQLGGVETASLVIPVDSAANDPEWGALLGADLLDRSGVVGFAGPPRSASNGDLAIDVVLTHDGSAGRLQLFDAIDAHAVDLGFPEVRMVGDAVQVARDSARLIRGQLAGLLVLVPVLGLVVALGLRSWRLGLLALLPNVAPVLVLYGLLGWLDRPLTVATVMIGCAMMGLVVDDTIHLLHGYAHARRRGRPVAEALTIALDRSGRAITVTSVVLACGLGAGAAGELQTTVEFSVLAAATVVLAWLLDLVVLPAVLLRLTPAAAHAQADLPVRSSPTASCTIPSTS